MIGAIIGDIAGSRFEFDRGGKIKNFAMFTPQCEFTDDTVMTVAVANALLQAGIFAPVEEVRRTLILCMRDWGRRYPGAGYGGRFYDWLFFQSKPKPYGSYGNGSAMRVSSAGWLYDSLERTCEIATATADVTHNHPEGVKGAVCTAAVIYLARTGTSKEEILDYVVKEYGYDLHTTVDELRLKHRHVETCQDSLPKALVSFREGTDFEDVVRNAISLGGDTDTIGAIAGSMAEAMYGVPKDMEKKALTYLPEDMEEVIQRFRKTIGKAK